MIRLSPGLLIAGCLLVALSCSGCRNTGGAFAMDSDSGAPFLGLNLSLPNRFKRPTLDTISDQDRPTEGRVQTADLPAEPKKKSKLPRWLGGEAPPIPYPQDAPIPLHGDEISLVSPQEEFP